MGKNRKRKYVYVSTNLRVNCSNKNEGASISIMTHQENKITQYRLEQKTVTVSFDKRMTNGN